MNTCINSRPSTYRDPTGEMTSVVATERQLYRAASESGLRGIPSRGRGSREKLTPRTMKKLGIFQAISKAMKSKKIGGKGRESQSSDPALIPIPNLEEDDILAEIEEQKRETGNYFGADPSSSFSSIGVSSMSDITDFFQRPAAESRNLRSPPARSKVAATSSPTTPPTRGIGRYNSWLLRQNDVGIGNTSSSSPRPLEKEQNGWESPLTTPTRASTGLQNSGAYGGLTGSSPCSSPLVASRPPLPRPPLAGPPLHSGGITTPMSVQKGKVVNELRQSSPSSVPKTKVPWVARGNISLVRGREQPPLSSARNTSQSYSPRPSCESPAIPLAPPNQNGFLGPPLNDQPVRGSRESRPLCLAQPGAQSIPFAHHHPACPISDPERTRSRIVPQRSDLGRKGSGRCLTLTPTKPGAPPSRKSPNSGVEGSLGGIKQSTIPPFDSAHMSFRGQNKTISTEDKKSNPNGASQIEIAPGILKPLRGSEETWKAIETGNIVPTVCISCALSLHCLDDAEYVICPACRVVGPVECCLQGFGRGIGLGVKDEQLALWRAEIQSRRF